MTPNGTLQDLSYLKLTLGMVQMLMVQLLIDAQATAFVVSADQLKVAACISHAE